MDRRMVLAFGDAVQRNLIDGPDVINTFDPRMSTAAIDNLVQRICANPTLQRDFPRIDVHEAVQQVLAERREAAASQAICVRISRIVGSRFQVFARHCRSGLRVRMTVDPDTAMVSYVQAKASEIREPICPSPTPGRTCEMTGPDPRLPIVMRYGGLGIGTAVYTAAARAAGDHGGRPVRVIGHPSTSYSHAVRWKLHCQDPYVWHYARCAKCARVKIDWATASPSIQFPPHERFGPDQPNYI